MVNLSVDVSHLEYSSETPIAAVERVAEQVGSAGVSSKVNWDAASQSLTFEPLLIDVLSDDNRLVVQDELLHDPLAGGFLEIDPLVFAGVIDGNRYFRGNQIRLVDTEGRTLMWADMPIALFDNTLFDLQGFNFFAPLMQTNVNWQFDSIWLDWLGDKLTANELFAPELFLGFDLPWTDDGELWNTNFEVAPRAVLSFPGVPLEASVAPVIPVPAPAAAWLLILGWGLFVIIIRGSRNPMNSTAQHSDGQRSPTC